MAKQIAEGDFGVRLHMLYDGNRGEVFLRRVEVRTGFAFVGAHHHGHGGERFGKKEPMAKEFIRGDERFVRP